MPNRGLKRYRPRGDDIHTILVLGSGPIVIGQGCEFDYSGTQACKALQEEGYRVVLVNSNPATIMTDPALSDRTYIEPITPEAVEKIIQREAEEGTPIDALLPTLGGQTALNCACELHDQGILEKHGVRMIGADREVIRRAEDREVFHEIVDQVGLKQPLSKTVETLEEAHVFPEKIGLPAIIRPAYTLGGSGGGIAYNLEEFDDIVRRGLNASMISQVLIDQSLLGWKEYELEVVRDANDNCVIVCGIENIDAMGQLKDKLPIPLATGEMLYTKYEFRDLIAARAADILQPDIVLCGGLLESKKIAAMAEANYLTIAPHNPLGGMSTAVSAHFAASTGNFLILEYRLDTVGPNSKLLKKPIQFDDGYLVIPETPGLGVEVNEDAIKNHPLQYWRRPLVIEPDGNVAYQ